MTTKSNATSAVLGVWTKVLLMTLAIGCGSNQVSIGEKTGDASAGGATGSVDAPASHGGAPEGGASMLGGASAEGGNTGAGGASLVAGNSKIGGASALGGASLMGGSKNGGSTSATGGSASRCGGYNGEECPSGQFCEYFGGGCQPLMPDGVGACVARPEVCGEDYAPVCGCDGTTYGNDCKRRSAGVGKASGGPCGGTGGTGGKTASGGTGGSASGGTTGSSSSTGKPCSSDTTCGTGEFCDLLIGNCGTTLTQDPAGICVRNAGIGGCLAVWQPVCGCDGKTYPTDCDRRIAGISKRSDGECAKDGGTSDAASSNAALCTATGGVIKTLTCCPGTTDFPNSCLAGGCGCDPAIGHDISVCNCAVGCFVPGEGCFKCTVGADQTCNNDPTISSLHGKCMSNGYCSCNTGYKPLANGRCE